MNLEEQRQILRKLSKVEFEGLSWVCVNQDFRVPKPVLLKLARKGLIIKLPAGGYDVVSYFVHRAWCSVCTEIEEGLEKKHE